MECTSAQTSTTLFVQLAALNRKELKPIEANKICKQWPHSALVNDGFINFGFATNAQVSQKTLEYLPSYISADQCGYEQLRGSPYLRQLLSKDLKYTVEQTVLFNSISGVIDTFAFRRKVSYRGKRQNLALILQHTESVQTSEFEADLQFFQANTEEEVIYILGSSLEKPTVVIVPDRSFVLDSKNQYVTYAYEHTFEQEFKCAVVFCRDEPLLASLEKGVLVFHPVSTLFAATIEACNKSQQNKAIEQEFMGDLRNQLPSVRPILKMLQLDSGYVPKQENLFIGLGSTCCLNNWAFSLFKRGDKVGIDTPFYFFFKHDFAKSEIILSYRSICSGTLLERVRHSYGAGEKGYIIVSPHNPTGIIIDAQEIAEVCQWGSKHPEYYLLFDEIYRKSAHRNETKVLSAIIFADKYQNFSLIRGFSKDFGLCGFREGFIVTCNQKIRYNFSKWSALIQPQPYLLHTIGLMLQKSNYGQDIYAFNQKCLLKSTELIVQCLKEQSIEFTEPKGGIFLMIDLSKYLEMHPETTEKSMKQTLFYDYRVNVFEGLSFEAIKPGTFRLCYLIPEQSLEEGVRRIGKFLRGEAIWFNQIMIRD